MTDTTIDAGDLLHIAEENDIIGEIRDGLDEWNFGPTSLTEKEVSYRSVLTEVADELGMDDGDLDAFIGGLETRFDVELEPVPQYRTVYDLLMDIATQIYKAEEAQKAEEAAEAAKAAALAAAIKPTPTPAGPVLGVLLVPSLETHGRFLAIHDISVDEAKVLARDFTNHVVSNRKTKNYDATIDVVDDIEFFHNIVDFSQMQIADDSDAAALENELQALKVSNTRGVRGLRAVFVSKAGIIGVGTTVVYNPNWATKNYSDPDMMTVLEDIQDSFI